MSPSGPGCIRSLLCATGAAAAVCGKEVSARKILKELEWKPEVGFEEGMRRTVEWFSKIYQNETASLAAMG